MNENEQKSIHYQLLVLILIILALISYIYYLKVNNHYHETINCHDSYSLLNKDEMGKTMKISSISGKLFDDLSLFSIRICPVPLLKSSIFIQK